MIGKIIHICLAILGIISLAPVGYFGYTVIWKNGMKTMMTSVTVALVTLLYFGNQRKMNCKDSDKSAFALVLSGINLGMFFGAGAAVAGRFLNSIIQMDGINSILVRIASEARLTNSVDVFVYLTLAFHLLLIILGIVMRLEFLQNPRNKQTSWIKGWWWPLMILSVLAVGFISLCCHMLWIENYFPTNVPKNSEYRSPGTGKIFYLKNARMDQEYFPLPINIMGIASTYLGLKSCCVEAKPWMITLASVITGGIGVFNIFLSWFPNGRDMTIFNFYSQSVIYVRHSVFLACGINLSVVALCILLSHAFSFYNNKASQTTIVQPQQVPVFYKEGASEGFIL